MNANPEVQHQWLKKFIGQWTFASVPPTSPDQPNCNSSGHETVRPLGELWIIGEGEMTMPDDGATGQSRLQLGYDPARKRFVGTWIGSMMTHQWVYDGYLNEAQTVLTLECEGPEFGQDGTLTGKMTRYRDVHEFKSNDHRTLTAYFLRPDGEWQQMMQAEYRRK